MIGNLKYIAQVPRVIRAGRKIAPIVAGIGTATTAEAAIGKAVEIIEQLPFVLNNSNDLPTVEIKEEQVKNPTEVPTQNWKTITTSLPNIIFINVIGRPVAAVIRGTIEGLCGVVHGVCDGARLKNDVAVDYSNTAIDPNNNVLLLISQEVGSGRYIVTGEMVAMIKLFLVKGIIIIVVTVITVRFTRRIYPAVIKKSFQVVRQIRYLKKLERQQKSSKLSSNNGKVIPVSPSTKGDILDI